VIPRAIKFSWPVVATSLKDFLIFCKTYVSYCFSSFEA
jgi:hypothetical protein